MLELLLAIVIMGVIAAFAIVLSGSVRNAAKVRDTEGRMSEIAAKAKATYRNSENLPVATGGLVQEPAGQDRTVPVGSTEFNMEAKYRYDSWGTPFRYYVLSPLNIVGLTVNGVLTKKVAAILVSSGPNGRADSTITGTNINIAGDDIVLGIDVSQEAVEIALDELKVLQSKVSALDAVYQGINNDADGTVDENGCVHAPNGSTGCPPSSLTNDPTYGDPNCGTSTLDNIETDNYGCPVTTTNAITAIIQIFSLSTVYQTDPWGNSYQWGCAPLTLPPLPRPVCSSESFNVTNTSDPRYHKFFSMGPNGTAGDADDIIP